MLVSDVGPPTAVVRYRCRANGNDVVDLHEDSHESWTSNKKVLCSLSSRERLCFTGAQWTPLLFVSGIDLFDDVYTYPSISRVRTIIFGLMEADFTV